MNKNLFALLSVLVLTSLVLSACGPAATPAPAPTQPSRIVAMSFCEPRSCRLQLSS